MSEEKNKATHLNPEIMAIIGKHFSVCMVAEGVNTISGFKDWWEKYPLQHRWTGISAEDVEAGFNAGRALAEKEIASAVAAEREACAKLLESQRYMITDPLKTYTAYDVEAAFKYNITHLAKAIRARGQGVEGE